MSERGNSSIQTVSLAVVHCGFPSAVPTAMLGILSHGGFSRSNPRIQTNIIYYQHHMDTLLRKHYELRQELRGLEYEEVERKRLVELCVVRILSQSHKSTATLQPQTINQGTTEKLRELERRISVLKQQIATKDTVHEAKVEQLKDTINDLRRELNEKSSDSTKLKFGKATLLSPPGSSGGRTALPNLSDTSMFSPGSEGRSVFQKTLFSPVLSRPNVLKEKRMASNKTQSLKDSLSREGERSNIFSSPNSSTSTNASKRKRLVTPDGNDGNDANDIDNIEANLTSLGNLSLMTSDEDDTFQSASGSLLGKVTLPRKKRKIQLMSSEALKVSLDSHGKKLHLEEEEMNSLDQYQDANFQDDTHSSPLRHPHHSTQQSGSQPKKKHVFKI